MEPVLRAWSLEARLLGAETQLWGGAVCLEGSMRLVLRVGKTAN